MQKLRARDRSDYDSIMNGMKANIKKNRNDIDDHSTYFNVFAQSIALLTENLNMQMESEYADIFDRSLMALYGNKQEQPTFMDHTSRKKDVLSYLKSPNGQLNENEPYPQADITDGKVTYN